MPRKLSNATLSSMKINEESIRPHITDYNDFVDKVNRDIDRIIDQFSRAKNIYYDSMVEDNPKNGENLINVSICNGLELMGWEAAHDPNVNGHCDIVVTYPYTNYMWLGEGKIRQDKGYHYKGLKQLLHRYSTGLDNQTEGGLLIYITKTNINQKKITDGWQNDIKDLDSQQLEIEDLDKDEIPISKAKGFTNCSISSFAFYSHHQHPTSGLDYRVRHRTIDFRHQPKDQPKKPDK